MLQENNDWPQVGAQALDDGSKIPHQPEPLTGDCCREIPMKIARTLFVSAAAVGLVAAPIAAQAAPARTASSTAQSEELAGGGTILYVALAAAAVTLAILIANQDDDTSPPVSP
jgi:hypothetical protein